MRGQTKEKTMIMGMHGRQEKKDKLYARSTVCGICGQVVSYKKANLDHIIPKSKGGGNGMMNLQIAHSSCNNAKGNSLGRGLIGERIMSKETYEQQMQDSDIIFTQISSGDFDDFKIAEQAVVMLYVTDMSFSRAGISHALKRLERFYAE